jgi:hypothetical protein
MQELKTSGNGTLYDANGFLVPVVSGTWTEMGEQYGALMVEHMQTTWDVLVADALKKGAITDDDVRDWAHRARTKCSTRNRQWYEGVAKGSGWAIDKVCFLDHLMEFGVYQSKIHSFAGCTSILSWGSHSADGGMYIGRNMDWSGAFNEFPQMLTVRKPTDGSYCYATAGWPGMYCPFTALNEHGVYFDLHDGTSMGGSLIAKERPSLLNVLTDFMSECASLDSLISRFNGTVNSAATIFSMGDEKSGASMECSSLAGNRVRLPDGDSMAVANTFFARDWGLGARETVSNSIRRFENMTARLAEHEGQVDAGVVRNLMDLRLFNEDGSFAENGGCTKPTKQDADLTNHTVVTDVKARKMWMKVPVPDHFQDWTEINVGELWS